MTANEPSDLWQNQKYTTNRSQHKSRESDGNMKEDSRHGGSTSNLMVAEPSTGDFLNESYFVRGQSNNKEFRMAVSNKGKQSLEREGYMYRLDHSGKDKLSWRCSIRGCPAHLKTDHSIENIVQDNDKPHTHPADAHKFERQLLRIACKRKAVQDCNVRAQDIISDEMTRLNDQTRPRNTKFLQLAMYRERKKAFPKLSRSARHVKKEVKSEKKMGGHSDSVTAIPQPHIPDPPTNFFQPTTAAAFHPHFDLLTEDDGSDFHHHEPHHHHHHPHHHSQHHPHHHENNSMQSLPQQLHSLHQPPPQLPPPPPPPQLQQHLLIHPHQQPQQQQPPHEGSLSQMLFSSNHLAPAPVVVASTTNNSSSNVSQFTSCALETKICYADIRLHEDMLSDKVCTVAYRRALQENCSQLSGTTVLDVGAGTGILSHFAVQAGAAKVYAIESSSMAVFAEKVVRENNAVSSITVIQSKLETADIPVKVDAIVSKWMGHNLLYESKLPSLLMARDQFLRQGGELYPNYASLYLAPITDSKFQERLKSWKQMKSLYGVTMESMVTLTRDALTVRADSQHLDMDSVLASACRLCSFDLKTMTLQDAQQIRSEFSFRCYGQGTMHGFASWFTVAFPGSVTIDTSPFALQTHWGQTVMYLKTPVNVKPSSEIKGTYSMHQSPDNPKFWDIEIEYQVNRGRRMSQQWQCAD